MSNEQNEETYVNTADEDLLNCYCQDFKTVDEGIRPYFERSEERHSELEGRNLVFKVCGYTS